MRSAITLAALAFVVACARPQDQEMASDTTAPVTAVPMTTSQQQPITDRDWSLATLGGDTNPLGNGNRPPTLRLDSSNSRASGFAGCNRFTGSYTLNADSLSFGPLAATKMACAQGNEVEVAYLQALSQVRGFTASDSLLTLHGDSAGVVVATFR